jgi:hypothetical protein
MTAMGSDQINFRVKLEIVSKEKELRKWMDSVSKRMSWSL